MLSKEGVKHCWECGKHLQWMSGGYVSFRAVIDKDNVIHRVHGDCLEAILSGPNPLNLKEFKV